MMKKSLISWAAGLVMIVGVVSPAVAGQTTVDISGYVNSNVAINPSTFPVGLSSGNQGTGIQFDVAQFPSSSGVAGSWNPDYLPGNSIAGPVAGASLSVDLSGLNISGQASFYALLNNYFGTPNANEYNITITATNNDSVTFTSIGGVDTRDYNSNVFTNTLANTTTPWFDNRIGQRFDVREFTLPSFFMNDTIASFTITQVSDIDAVVFSGLTFSDQNPVAFGAVPEPNTLVAACAGLMTLGLFVRRRRNPSSK